MSKLTNKDLINLTNDLSDALIKFSNGKLNPEKSRNVAELFFAKLDLNNSVLFHKGINWYAKELVDSIDFDKMS